MQKKQIKTPSTLQEAFASSRLTLRKRMYRIETMQGYLSLLANIAIMAILVVIAFTQVFSFTTARGTNMYPAILDGDILLGYRLEKNLVKNDVVICNVNGQEVVGRIVAKEHDTVNITEEGRLYVNGTEQVGEIVFLTDPGENLEYPYVVPTGSVFLLGDFRTNTVDSRDYGPVLISDVSAKVVSIFRRRGI